LDRGLERQEFREWLMRRLGEPPLAAPVDPASFGSIALVRVLNRYVGNLARADSQ
jgi:hypothetical protein